MRPTHVSIWPQRAGAKRPPRRSRARLLRQTGFSGREKFGQADGKCLQRIRSPDVQQEIRIVSIRTKCGDERLIKMQTSPSILSKNQRTSSQINSCLMRRGLFPSDSESDILECSNGKSMPHLVSRALELAGLPVGSLARVGDWMVAEFRHLPKEQGFRRGLRNAWMFRSAMRAFSSVPRVGCA